MTRWIRFRFQSAAGSGGSDSAFAFASSACSLFVCIAALAPLLVTVVKSNDR
jgi:hypothetical protein